MNPTANNARGVNTHSYPAYDYPVGIGTGLVAVKSGVIRDMPGQPTRAIMSPLRNWQAWPNAGGGTPNSGNVISIDHGNGEWTSYLHCSPFDVNALRGRHVKQGEVFAQSGHNGWSTGPHLHFEVWKNGNRIDPGPWLNSIKKEGDDMARIENTDNWFHRCNRLMVQMRGREMDRAEFNKNFVGNDAWRMTEIMSDGIEADQEFTRRVVGIPNDGDIINFKRAGLGVPNYQPPGPEFDYYKSFDRGFKQLGYDTIDAYEARIKDMKPSEYKEVGTIDGETVYKKVKK